MVHSARFELTTYCSGGNRSIQLSYECLYQVLYNTFEISQTANSLFLKKNLQSRNIATVNLIADKGIERDHDHSIQSDRSGH